MNDPGLGDVVEESGDHVHNALPRREDERPRPTENEGDDSIYQPTQYWFACTTFPLIAGTFGPIANLFSVCALVQTWRVGPVFDAKRVGDPPWLIALNATSLFFALGANFVLLLNFARRIPYAIAQRITITFWYIASLLLLIPLCLIHSSSSPFLSFPQIEYSQAYYYALIACILYSAVSTLLLLNTLGATLFHAYPPSFSTLSSPQRTLMLQTISFTLYLALGAGVFSRIEGWGFADGVYWADYTLLTIGLGTDFPLTTTLARFLLIPYAAVGIMTVGLVVSSVRGLVLERAKAKLVRRHLGKEREKWKESINERRRILDVNEKMVEAPASASKSTQDSRSRSWLEKRKEKRALALRLPTALPSSASPQLQKDENQGSKLHDEKQGSSPHEKQKQKQKQNGNGAWHRAEFELMRHLEKNAETRERYAALSVSFGVILVVWCGGAVVFWVCEHKTQHWTFPESFYFTYTTLLTIGYGDFYPNSAAGKPFFVVWSLISVPAMTVLISNLGETVVRWVRDVTVWVGGWTVLPEKVVVRGPEGGKRKDKGTTNKHLHRRRKKTRRRRSAPHAHEEDGTPLTPPPPMTLQRDVELLSALEEDEARLARGRGELEGAHLASRIAREITLLARDLRVYPGRKYVWEEWVGWLDMLGETDGRVPLLIHQPLAGGGGGRRTSPSSSQNRNTDPQATDADAHNSLNTEWNWTWLADHGPLFSQRTETEWILERLCVRLEEVMEARGGEEGDV